MREWIKIDENYKNNLPKKDCEIWITRVSGFCDPWVQKVHYYAETLDIEWDGTIAFMVAEDKDKEPTPYSDRFAMAIQNYRQKYCMVVKAQESHISCGILEVICTKN